jgi:hypothetical protein
VGVLKEIKQRLRMASRHDGFPVRNIEIAALELPVRNTMARSELTSNTYPLSDQAQGEDT